MTEYLPPRLRAAKGFTLVERDVLAEIHAQDREGGCPDDAERLSDALCGVRPQHVAAAIAKFRQARLIEVVLDPQDTRLLRTTKLSDSYWAPIDEPLYPNTGGGNPCGSTSPNTTSTTGSEAAPTSAPSPSPFARPVTTAPASTAETGATGTLNVKTSNSEKLPSSGVSSSTVTTAENPFDPSPTTSDPRPSKSQNLCGECDYNQAAHLSNARAPADRTSPYNVVDLDLPTGATNETEQSALLTAEESGDVENENRACPAVAEATAACPAPQEVADQTAVRVTDQPGGTSDDDRDTATQENPVSEACPSVGGDRDLHSESATREKITREELAEQLHDTGAYKPRTRDGPASLRAPRGGLAAAVVAERQGGYCVPEDLFHALPAEVVLALNRGEPCIPMKADKKPLVKWKDYQDRLPTAHEIRRWTLAFRDQIAGWARVTGRISGLIVLDDDGGDWLARWGLPPHVLTGRGGFHWIGAYPGWRVKTMNAKTSRLLGETYPLLDIRGDGGYSIIAGFTDRGGYKWLREPRADPLDLLPGHVRRFFGLEHAPRPGSRERIDTPGPLPRPGDRVPTEVLITRAVRIAAGYGRNNSCFWLACQARDNGYTQSECEGLHAAFATQVGGTNTRGDTDPFTQTEWEATVRSAYTHPARGPWPTKP